MAVEIKVPPLGESVSEATVAKWYKAEGDAVSVDELVAELETDKVTLEVMAPADGVIEKIHAPQGENVTVGTVIGVVKAGAKAANTSKASAPAKTETPAPAPQAASSVQPASTSHPMPPSVARLVAENQLNPSSISATGKGGRLTKGDVITAMESGVSAVAQQGPREERVKMTRLRQSIAKRLKDSQNTAAILTTFNEVDMTNVMAIRNRYKDDFQKKHGVKLGFMSFFVKAAIVALQEIPAINAEISGDEIIYKNHYDIGVAVGTEQGLVVPVVRDAHLMSFAGIESTIADFGKKARDGKLTMEDMQGGTFTVSNGGVYGSLLSTPIINPPQSGILGMHKTQERPAVIDGKIEARPMMYLALSYDHRIVDGKEAVTFLVRVKECIESPERLLFDL